MHLNIFHDYFNLKADIIVVEFKKKLSLKAIKKSLK